MEFTFLPHALERMELNAISEAEVRSVIEEAGEEGDANLGRRYSQKELGGRRIRVICNTGTGETVVVTVMLRRKEGGSS